LTSQNFQLSWSATEQQALSIPVELDLANPSAVIAEESRPIFL
jgi:hypothetical protein